MERNLSPFHTQIQVSILVTEFWLSGMIILSSVFTMKDDLEILSVWMFMFLSVGSFIGGILGDSFGRKRLFQACSVILLVGCFLMLINPFYGYVLAAAAIGPLNNITFVIVMEGLPENKDLYTCLILMGWAFSEVCLGTYFLFDLSFEILFLLIFFFGLLFTIASFLFITETQNQQDRVPIQITKLIPSEFTALIAGCILMFTMQMFYYRTQFTLDRFGISAPLNTIVVGFTEIFADLFLIKQLKSLPRKRSLQVLFGILTGLFLLLLLLDSKMIQTVVQGVMRICDASIMLILGVYLPELFSPSQRSRGTNFVMSFGVIGSAFSQYILNGLPFWSLTLFLIIAGGSTLFLKETLLVRNYGQQGNANERLVQPRPLEEE